MILLRLHFISLSCMNIYHCVYVWNIFDYIFMAGYCWYRILLFIFPTLSYSLLQDKHKAWERADNPVKGSSIMKNFPSSLSVIARIRSLDLWLCRLQKSKTHCSSSGAAEMVELRCAFQVIQSKRERGKGDWPLESFQILVSFHKRTFGIVEFFPHVLMLLAFFCANVSMLFHIAFVLFAIDFIVLILLKQGQH